MGNCEKGFCLVRSLFLFLFLSFSPREADEKNQTKPEKNAELT